MSAKIKFGKNLFDIAAGSKGRSKKIARKMIAKDAVGDDISTMQSIGGKRAGLNRAAKAARKRQAEIKKELEKLKESNEQISKNTSSLKNATDSSDRTTLMKKVNSNMKAQKENTDKIKRLKEENKLLVNKIEGPKGLKARGAIKGLKKSGKVGKRKAGCKAGQGKAMRGF
jgi:hypothetical protein